MVEAFCKTTGIEWDPDMLVWDTEKDQGIAKEAFEKWKGFHEDALDSDRLRARTHEWKEKYGEEGAKQIRDTVAANVEHYEYLKQFAIKL